MINEPKTRKQSEYHNPFFPLDMEDQCLLPSVAEDILVCAPNWLGDGIMAMPAVQALKKKNPLYRITLLVKEELLPLWLMHPEVDAFIPLKKSLRGAIAAVREIRIGCFDRAFILPHSLRPALIVYLSRIPNRTGLAGYRRGLFLNYALRFEAKNSRAHQTFEYMDIMGLNGESSLEHPNLLLPRDAVAFCWHKLYASGWLYSDANDAVPPIVGLIPGATRGVSKQWPAEHFSQVGRRLMERMKCRIIVFGTVKELPLCLHVADEIGGKALSVAGETSLPELAAMLTLCTTVVTNDSGGMHLAAAVGTPVVVVFGGTDPARTGPLGEGHVILQKEGAAKDRRVKRTSPEAQRNLKSIGPDEVFDSVMKVMKPVQ